MSENDPNRKLPGAASFRMRILSIDLSSGLIMACLIVMIVRPVVHLTTSQLQYLIALMLITAVALSCVSFFFQQRLKLGPILNYLDHHENDCVSEEDRLKAFYHVTHYPQFMFVFLLSCYAIGSTFIVIMMNVRFESFDLASSSFMVIGAIGVGALSQLFAYTMQRAALEPIRDTLAVEIDDPDLRNETAAYLGFRTKIFVMIAGTTFVTSFLIMSLGYGHARNSVERFAAEGRKNVLEQLHEEASDSSFFSLPPESLKQFERHGISIVVIETDGSHIAGATNLLAPGDINTILEIEGLEGGTLDFLSFNSFNWLRSTEDDPYIIAVSDKEWIQIAGVNTDVIIPSMAFFAVAIAILVGYFAAKDFGHSLSVLDANLRRFSEGDMISTNLFESEDELGGLARSMDRTSRSLRTLLRGMAEAASNVEETAGEVGTTVTDISTVTTAQVDAVEEAKSSMELVSDQASDIVSASNVLAESIQESSSAIIELQASSSELSGNATVLGERADDSSSSLEQMTMSNHQVIGKTELLDNAVLNASSKIEGLASAMQQVEESATESAASSMRVIEFSDRGRDAVQQTIDGIEEIQSNTTAASNVIEALGERGREIGTIIGVINDVADETNLLALNAAIIAAQAGEQGKAFSVVANQIKELADRVLQSTKEVTGLIGSLQDGTIDAVTVMRAGEASVLAGVKVAAEAGSTLQEIDTAARLSGDRASQIVDAMREQASSTLAIKALMTDVLGHVGEIRHTGKEQTGCSESNLQDALVVGEVAKELRRAAEEQALGTGRIRGNLDEVRESIQMINDALQEQSVANRNILNSTESIQERTVSNERSVVTMRNVVDRLNEQARSLREGLQRFKF